jgi:hypothetical protein
LTAALAAAGAMFSTRAAADRLPLSTASTKMERSSRRIIAGGVD